MLYWYLADCDLVEGAAETAERFEQRARALITQAPGTLSLHYGLAGVGTAAICSPRNASRPYAERLCRSIDLVLARALRKSPWEGGFDLFWGLVGFGVYAGFRLEEPASREILVRIVELLHDFTEVNPDGLAWRTRPENLFGRARELHPNGYYDFGLAHGAPGVIALLSHCVHLGVDPVRARRLVTETLPWLRSMRRADPTPPRYANWVDPGERPGAARVAWCHGDTSVAIAMLAAGRFLAVPEWEREAIDLAREAADCPPSRDGVLDAGLCHGSAGVGHMLSRMAQHTGDGALEDAARRWLERVLRMRMPGHEIAGFPTMDGLPREWKPDDGVLSGAAGVALVLAAAISSAPPVWDRIFLLSWPEPAPANAPGRPVFGPAADI